MKRIVSFLLCLILMIGIVCVVGAADAAVPQDNFILSIPVRYKQTEARKLLSLLNAFRTGGDAWYWNEDNSSKVNVSGLKALTYDYELEQIAKSLEIEQTDELVSAADYQGHNEFLDSGVG